MYNDDEEEDYELNDDYSLPAPEAMAILIPRQLRCDCPRGPHLREFMCPAWHIHTWDMVLARDILIELSAKAR